MSAYFRVNFHVADNEDLRQSFALTDAVSAAIDLSGASFEMHIATAAGDAVLELSTANGRIALISPTTGHFEVSVPAAVIGTLPEGIYRHDLIMVRASRTKRVWSGGLTIERGVTR